MIVNQHYRAVRHVLRHCAGVGSDEPVTIVYDIRTEGVAKLFAEEARWLSSHVAVLDAPVVTMHGIEPPPEVAAAMADAAVILGLTYTSMAHTRARQAACARGARYLSLPEYSLDLLGDPAIVTNYRAQAPTVRRMAEAFTRGASAHISTALGTDIHIDIKGRRGNYCPGFVDLPGELGSPPDIEANVSPVETESRGTIVVDGSIPCREIGLLASPITLHVERGRITSIDGHDSAVVATLDSLFKATNSDRAYVLAECGVGLNEDARLIGIMLTDEGAKGCMHFGFGSNATVGGVNDVPFHLDFCFRHATLAVDGVTLIRHGEVLV